MNNEVEAYVGELRDLRKIISFLQNNRKLIETRIQWLDSDIRFGVLSDFEKTSKRELKEFLNGILNYTTVQEKMPIKARVSGVPYEVEI